MAENIAFMQIGNAWWCDQHSGLHQGLLIGFDHEHRKRLHALFFNVTPVADFHFDIEVADVVPELAEAEDIVPEDLIRKMRDVREQYGQ